MKQDLLFCSCPPAEHSGILLHHYQIMVSVNTVSIPHLISLSKAHHLFPICAFGVPLLQCMEYHSPGVLSLELTLLLCSHLSAASPLLLQADTSWQLIPEYQY